MSEDKYLCSNAQKNLNAGVFVNGEMHPELEKGPLFFQGMVRDIVRTHYEREQSAGREIWPAQQVVPTSATATQKDESFCTAVDCCRNKGETLGIADSLATEIKGF